MIGKVAGIDLGTENGFLRWRPIFSLRGEETIRGRWQQTAPILGFSALMEGSDKAMRQRLERALARELVGYEVVLERGQPPPFMLIDE